MTWEEFELRGERRRYRRYPERTDVVTLTVGALLFFLVVLWIVWGVMS